MMNKPLLHFIETTAFTKRIDKLAGREVLFDLQNDLILAPERGDIIVGTLRREKRAEREKGGSAIKRKIAVKVVLFATFTFIFKMSE